MRFKCQIKDKKLNEKENQEKEKAISINCLLH